MAAVLTTDLYRFILLGDTPSARVYYEPLGSDDKSLSAPKYVDIPMVASSFVTLAGANLPVGTKRVFILGVRGTVRYNTSGSQSGVTVGLEPTVLSDVLMDGMMLGIDTRAAIVTELPRYVILAGPAGGTLVCDPIGVNGESLDDPISVSASTIEAQTFVVRADVLLPVGTEGVRIISVTGDVYFNTSGTADGDTVAGREPTTSSLKAVAGMTWGRIDKLTVESSDGGTVGGGTQYAEGAMIATPTGNVFLGKGPTDAATAARFDIDGNMLTVPKAGGIAKDFYDAQITVGSLPPVLAGLGVNCGCISTPIPFGTAGASASKGELDAQIGIGTVAIGEQVEFFLVPGDDTVAPFIYGGLSTAAVTYTDAQAAVHRTLLDPFYIGSGFAEATTGTIKFRKIVDNPGVVSSLYIINSTGAVLGASDTHNIRFRAISPKVV